MLTNHFRLEKFGPAEGLRQKSIRTILQDRQGFLWLGSETGGLVRYDGYSFHTFEHLSYDSTSLSANNVRCLFEDSRGWIWVGTIEGLNCYYPENGLFQRIYLDGKNSASSLRNWILAISEDNAGNIWVGSKNGLYQITIASNETQQAASGHFRSFRQNRFTMMPEDSLHRRNAVTALHFDAQDNFWIGTGLGLGLVSDYSSLTSKTQLQLSFGSLSGPNNQQFDFSTSVIHGFLTATDGTFWVLEHNALTRLEKTGDQWQMVQFPFPDAEGIGLSAEQGIAEISTDIGSEIWIASFNGAVELLMFNPQTGKYRNYREIYAGGPQAPPRSLFDAAMWAVYQDRSGLIWLGSGTGLHLYDPLKERFSAYHPDLSAIANASAFNQRFTYPDSRGNLWLVTENIFRGNRNNGTVKQVNLLPAYGQPNWAFINTMLEDRNGDLWFGSEFQGIIYYDPVKEVIKSHFLPQTDADTLVAQDNITVLSKDRRGHIWAGSERSMVEPKISHVIGRQSILYEFTPGNNTFQEHPIATFPRNSEQHYIYAIDEGSDELLWVGTNFGLIRYNRISREIKNYQTSSNGNSLNNGQVLAVLADPALPERYIWIGTNGGGLNRLDTEADTFSHYTSREGLPGNVVSSILDDDAGNLWLASNRGVVKISLSTDQRTPVKIQTYTAGDGLHGEDYSFFYGQNAFKSNQGELIFTSPKGFDIIRPDGLTVETDAPQIMINELQVHYRPLLPGSADSPLTQPISLTKKLTLAHDQNTLTFEMIALHFRAPAKNQYAYKMDGYDKDWVQNGNRRSAHYTGLPPGNYTFRAKAANSNGVWNESGAALQIIITPPWWKTWWAYLLYGLFLLGAFFGIRRYERNRQQLKHDLELEHLKSEQDRREADKLKELDRLKTRFFTNISHEFRTPLTLIMGPVEQLFEEITPAKSRQKLSIIQRNAQRLFHLINQLLDLSRLEANRLPLHAAPGDIAAFLKGLTMGFSSWAERKEITLQIIISETVETIHQSPTPFYFDRDFMEKIVNNLLSNAMKFTSKNGKITVEVEIVRPTSDLPLQGILNAKPQFLQIRVSDNGIGISPERLPHIFDRFYQADASSTREYEGTGVGLALCKDLVERHYGEIEVNSTIGKGSSFTIHFPLGKAHLPSEDIAGSVTIAQRVHPVSENIYEANVTDMPLSSPSKSGVRKNAELDNGQDPQKAKIILLVEDHSDFRFYLRSCLADLSGTFNIIEAANGQAGLETAREVIPDIIISDVMMPKMNGYQLCDALKTDERTSHIPLILLTAKASQADKIHGLETGADDYLSKPFDPKELLARVHNLINQRQKLLAKIREMPELKPDAIEISSMDKVFLEKALKIVNDNLENENFSVPQLADAAGMSRSQFHRKISAITGLNAGEFILSIRLQRAEELIRKDAATISEIAYMSGFNSPNYFTKVFRKKHGMSPSAYRKARSGV